MRWEDYLGKSENAITCLSEGGRGKYGIDTQGRQCDHRGRDQSDTVASQGTLQPPAAGRGEEPLSLTAQEGARPLGAGPVLLILDSASRTVTEENIVALSHSVCSNSVIEATGNK